MSEYGVKISKPTFDVKTASENELNFYSKYPLLKIHSSGSGSNTFTDEGTLELSTHSLGYRPFYAVWIDTNDGNGYRLITNMQTSGDWYVYFLPSASTTKLYLIRADTYVGGFFGDPTPVGNITVDYSWIIFYDPVLDV